ncbi:MAG: hypothetical protein O3A46_09410 [Candidatus Poribacteria bacterium]|nr:hypothetical protein [Candidatus Poribacteria bacterium]
MSLTESIRDFLDEYDAVEEFDDYEQESSFLRDAVRLLRQVRERLSRSDHPDHESDGGLRM